MTTALPRSLTSIVADRAGDRAVDPDVHALDQREGVVELRLDLVGAGRRPRGEDEDADDDDEQERDGHGDALGEQIGHQSPSSESSAMNESRKSSHGWHSSTPGVRWKGVSSSPGPQSDGPISPPDAVLGGSTLPAVDAVLIMWPLRS